jgi:hypothetical protein
MLTTEGPTWSTKSVKSGKLRACAKTLDVPQARANKPMAMPRLSVCNKVFISTSLFHIDAM